MTSNIPPAMKSIAPFLRNARQLEKVDPIMSYYCKQKYMLSLINIYLGLYYAVQNGIKFRSDDASKKFLLSLMDSLEKVQEIFSKLI